jgi:hypothetical protein
MKYVILIHSNPKPWGHPTSDYVPEFQDLPEDTRARLMKDFQEVLVDMQANGELVGGEALGGPTSASLYRWRDGNPLAVDGALLRGEGALGRVLPDRRREPGTSRADRHEVRRARRNRRAATGDGLWRPDQ